MLILLKLPYGSGSTLKTASSIPSLKDKEEFLHLASPRCCGNLIPFPDHDIPLQILLFPMFYPQGGWAEQEISAPTSPWLRWPGKPPRALPALGAGSEESQSLLPAQGRECWRKSLEFLKFRLFFLPFICCLWRNSLIPAFFSTSIPPGTTSTKSQVAPSSIHPGLEHIQGLATQVPSLCLPCLQAPSSRGSVSHLVAPGVSQSALASSPCPSEEDEGCCLLMQLTLSALHSAQCPSAGLGYTFCNPVKVQVVDLCLHPLPLL